MAQWGVTRDDAERAAAQVRAETGLSSTIGTDADDEYWVDIEVPTRGDEIKAVVTLHEDDDWDWLGPTHVLPRLRRP